MNMPAKADVDQATREALARLALGDPDLLADGLELRARWEATSGLDARSYALVQAGRPHSARRTSGVLPLAGEQRAGCRGHPSRPHGGADRHRAASRRPEDSGSRA